MARPSGRLDLSHATGSFLMRWYNPRTGSFEGPTREVTGGTALKLGRPPSDADEDWAILIAKAADR
jgi:hypothetical protein